MSLALPSKSSLRANPQVSETLASQPGSSSRPGLVRATLSAANATTTRQKLCQSQRQVQTQRGRGGRREKGGIWRVFILPADDGRGSTFYQAVKKTFATDNRKGRVRGRWRREEEGQTCNFLARSSFALLLRPLTLTQVQGRRQRARTGKRRGRGRRRRRGVGGRAVVHNAHNEVHFSYSRKN